MCKLCRAVVPNRTKLKKHAIDRHFKQEIISQLSNAKPFKCRETDCQFVGETFQALFRHFGSKHNAIEQFMPQVEYSKVPCSSDATAMLENGTSSSSPPLTQPEVLPSSHDAATSLEENVPREESRLDAHSNSNTYKTEGEHSSTEAQIASASSEAPPAVSVNDATTVNNKETDRSEPMEVTVKKERPAGDQPAETRSEEPRMPKPKNMAEFKKQVREILRTNDGRHAEALDERTIQCVCGKVIRVCASYYWRFLIQKPSIKNGQVVQKGHWFNCPVVAQRGSPIRPYVVTQEELDASVESGNDKDEDGRKRRLQRSLDGEPAAKRSKEEEFSMERHIRELMSKRVSGDTFLQDGPCFQMGFDLPMCHMCRYTSVEDRRELLMKGNFDDEDCDISCCFYAFRKLKLTSGGVLTVAGYLDPHKDPTAKDMVLWKTNADNPPDIPVDKVKYMLGLIGDQFCDMVMQERKCLLLHLSENKSIAWKPAVKGVRDMCDVCKTTIFNYHWTCGRCGIFFCLDCYQYRRTGLVKDEDKRINFYDDEDEVDEFGWPMCNNSQPHQMERLLMAQILPGDALVEMAKKLHQLRIKWNLTQFCHKQDETRTLFLNDESFQLTKVS
jgi:hypothetical protein